MLRISIHIVLSSAIFLPPPTSISPPGFLSPLKPPSVWSSELPDGPGVATAPGTGGLDSQIWEWNGKSPYNLRKPTTGQSMSVEAAVQRITPLAVPGEGGRAGPENRKQILVAAGLLAAGLATYLGVH